MLVYWGMFAVPSLFALIGGEQEQQERGSANWLGLAAVFVVFSLLIGLRYETGGDWETYDSMVLGLANEDFLPSLATGDPGFAAISWVSSYLGFGLNGSTTFCGIVLMYGLVRFCRDLSDPWLGIAAAVPYLIIVVGMGYIRQGAAIGFILLALRQFDRGDIAKFLVRAGLAILFHITSICLLPLVGIVILRQRIALLVPTAVLAAGSYYFLLQDRLDALYAGYIEAEYDSSGALVRLVMNGVPAALFLFYRKSFRGSQNAHLLWLLLATVSLAMLPLLLVVPSTTVLDRFGLYFIPLQMYVFGQLPQVVGGGERGARLVRLAVVSYYAVVLYVWLNYADFAYMWVPYRFLLTQ